MGARTWLTALLLAQALGCASEYKQCTLSQPPSDKASHLVIYRPIRWAYLVKSPISINGCVVGMLAARAVMRLDVTAGPVIIRAESNFGIDAAEIRTRVGPSETVFVRYNLIDKVSTFTFVDKAVAVKEITSLQEKGERKATPHDFCPAWACEPYVLAPILCRET